MSLPSLNKVITSLLSFQLGTGVEYVTSNCIGRAVRQFEKEPGVGYVTPNCMGRAVRQFEKEVRSRLGTGELLSH